MSRYIHPSTLKSRMFEGRELQQRHRAPVWLSRRRLSYLVILALFAGATPANAETPDSKRAGSESEFSFDPAVVDGVGRIDLSRFNTSGGQPGVHRVDVLVNGELHSRENIVFASLPGSASSLEPCFTEAELQAMGINMAKVMADAAKRGDSPDAADAASAAKGAQPASAGGQSCAPLLRRIPRASFAYDPADETLNLSIPQLYLQRSPRGWVAPDKWEDGIDAAFANYNLNYYRSDYAGNSTSSLYAGLSGGINLGAWRFRHSGTLTASTETLGVSETRYATSTNYLERPIAAIGGNLRVGETYADGSFFQAYRMLGVSVASDDRMLPDSQRGFAPIIRGVAQTNAKVEVLQASQVIYETSVAPGSFEINDLYPSSFSGDLTLRITEADGSVRTRSIPYASLPQMLRPETYRYAFSAGRYNENGVAFSPWVAGGTFQYGVNNYVTLYGGAQFAGFYRAGMVGSAFNTPLGALSLEFTRSSASLTGGNNYQGSSYRFAFSKLIPDSSTNITLAAYRYSTRDFLSLQDAVTLENYARNGEDSSGYLRQKTKLEATINQTLPRDLGQVYLTGSSQQFWNGQKQTNMMTGYSRNWKWFNLALSWQESAITPFGQATYNQRSVQLDISIPLGQPRINTATLTYSHQNSQDGSSSDQVGLNGSWGEQSEYTYYTNVTRNRQERSDSVSTVDTLNAGVGARTLYGNLSASIGHSTAYNQLSASLNGGVVAYQHGIKFGPPLTDSFAIVEAEGAEGARINGSDNKVGADGVGLATDLRAYRMNSIELDPKGLDAGVSIESASQLSAPTSGAVILAHYKTRQGSSVMIDVAGRKLPFGAQVLDKEGNVVGMVGQGGRVMVRLPGKKAAVKRLLAEDKSPLVVKWGATQEQQCRLVADKPARQLKQMLKLEASCDD